MKASYLDDLAHVQVICELEEFLPKCDAELRLVGKLFGECLITLGLDDRLALDAVKKRGVHMPLVVSNLQVEVLLILSFDGSGVAGHADVF